MTQTFIHLRVELIEKRFHEIEILLEQAVTKKSDGLLYATFCRSAHVLLVAHFEGMVKDIVKDVLDDLNNNLSFKESPTQIKRTYCHYYLNKNDRGDYDEVSIKKLIETFDELPTKLKIEPFLFENNKNPNPYIIDTILKKFGVKNFFMLLKNSDLDIVFQNIKSDTNTLKERLKNYLTENLVEYPYNVAESFYNPENPTSTQSQPRTLWQTFLDDFLNDRHSIVHGNTLENPKDHEEIAEAMAKIHVLIYAFIISVCRIATIKIAVIEQEPILVNVEQHDDDEQQEMEYSQFEREKQEKEKEGYIHEGGYIACPAVGGDHELELWTKEGSSVEVCQFCQTVS